MDSGVIGKPAKIEEEKSIQGDLGSVIIQNPKIEKALGKTFDYISTS